MANDSTDLRLIQVFLDTNRFIEMEEPQSGPRGSKDFYKDNDRAFVQHKANIRQRIRDISEGLRREQRPGGFVKVQQREEALAKSHRPLGSLFTSSNQFALVGTESAGALMFQATPAALDRLVTLIESRAEETPRMVENKSTGKLEPRVSEYRSELGGIEDIRLHGATERVRFSADDAIRWLDQSNAIGGYIVELFRPDRAVSPSLIDVLIRQFESGLQEFPGGLLVRPILPSNATAHFGEPSLALSIQLLTGSERYIELPFLPDGRALEMTEASLPIGIKGTRQDFSPSRHTELLAFLASQSLVRSVELPPVLETAPMSARSTFDIGAFPSPDLSAKYPVVGIVDGGVSDCAPLSPWKVGDAGLVPEEDRRLSHGTFIAGLVSGASALNPTFSAYMEPLGCKFFDLDLFPKPDLRGTYYQDIEDLFDTLDEKVKVAKRDHNVRIFNLSFSIGQRTSRLAYSIAADRLDRIARSNDVIFVVAAGNLGSINRRPAWPSQPDAVVTMLAGFGSQDQQITAPSDHLLGLTVGAINPPGVSGHVHLMPTTYTRRGPGPGGARKPDVAHYGGADAVDTGLCSLTPAGDLTCDCGTSFAAPLTAATLATLDHRLEMQAPRETLLALSVHRARRAPELDKKALKYVSREFVGFGLTPPADSILNDVPSSVTLVFHDLLLAKQKLEFPFAWPQSLVGPDGRCRGKVEITLCYTPPIDPDHREEAIRVLLDAHLHQEILDEETGELTWESRLSHDSAEVPSSLRRGENYLIKSGLKWTPIKRYNLSMPQGRGNTSNWRLGLDSLSRASVIYPKEGVRFSLVMTISDADDAAGVREEMRVDLQNRGLVLADITLAHRLRPR